MRQIKTAIGFPLSVLISLICAAGGCCLFAAYYWSAGELFTGVKLSEVSIAVLRNYTFVFVFSVMFSSSFTIQKIFWNGGKGWNLFHVIFIGFFLLTYMFRFWPQSPEFYPQFTVRAVLWYGGASALCILVSRMCVEYDRVFKTAEMKRWFYQSRNFVLFLSGLTMVVPLVVSIVSGTVFNFSAINLSLPLLVLFVIGIFLTLKFESLSRVETISHLIVPWFPLSLCFLLMPPLFILDKIVSKFYGYLFHIEASHLYSAFIGFCFLALTITLCPGLIKLIRPGKGQNYEI